MSFDIAKEFNNWLNKLLGKGTISYSDYTKKMEEFIASVEQQAQDAIPDKPTLPDTPTYEKMATDDRSDEELSELAKSMLAEYEQLQKKAIDNQISSTQASLDASKDVAKQSYDSLNQSIEQAHDAAKKSVEDDTLKRGLARSSIAANQISAVEGSRADAKTRSAESYQNQLAQIETELASLEGKRQQALDEFDMAYASKLTQEINTLKQQRDKTNTEALKYNNSLLEQQQDDLLEKQKTEASLYSQALDDKSKEQQLTAEHKEQQAKENEQALYRLAQQQLTNMSQADRNRVLRYEFFLRDNLSPYYFGLLCAEFYK